MICGYRVTKQICSKYRCAFAFSAQNPCYFGPHADAVASVLREVSMSTVLTRYHCLNGSEAESREELAGASLKAGTLSSTRCSEIFSNHSGRSRNGSLSSFFVFTVSVGSGDGSLHARLLVLSHCVDAGRNVGITASCGSDAGDLGVAELEEPIDKPKTTIGTYFPCCIVFVCHFQ